MRLAPWHAEAWRVLSAARARGALPHALLLCGAAGMGKRDFAEHYAAWLLCERTADAPCGACRSCRLFAVRTQRDPEETRPGGMLAQPHGHANHPDARFVGFVYNPKSSPRKMYGELVVEQVRELSDWLALPPQFGRAQVALIEPADMLNAAAANALLKTLEEPGAERYMVLVSAHPSRLPATIRSRCQRIDFHLPAAEVAQSWLRAQGVGDASAQDALHASDGNPGRALEWSRSSALKLRREVAQDLRDLAAARASAFDVAQRWSRDEVDLRLHFAAALVREAAQAQARGAAAEPTLALTPVADLPKLTAWFDRANRTRDLLRGPLRADLALIELLAAWTAPAAAR